MVLLNWNDRAQAERSLDAVLASAGVEVDALVVDNGSRGDDVAVLTRRLGPDRVLSLPENYGYAGGMNAGLRFWRERAGEEGAGGGGGGAPVLVLTPDAIVQPDTLRRLAEELDRTPDAGLVGPLVVHARDPGWVSAGGRVIPGRVESGPLHEVRSPEPHDVDWIDGCCMLIRGEALREVEGFDDRFFIYFEETDLCARVRAAGWRVRLVPGTEIDHPKTPGTLPPYYFYYMVRNRYLFWAKNYGVGFWRVAARVARATVWAWGSVAKALVLPSRRGQLHARLRDARLQLRAALVGTLDHLRGRYGRMPASRMPRSAR